ncbi:MAG: bifunctional transcriptional activator/DNA repair protein Ada [Alphaproteobacteria bacterium]|nr:bifunctional transcriptional activator/DNA repair protein Ada [Alphaproteobacteria bacterium]
MTVEKDQEYYQALMARNSSYEGVFYVGVKTTGIFCRPTCSARKPKFENCEFFEKASEALHASYRPCQRCLPLSHPSEVSPLVQMLVNAVEENPAKRWKDRDFQALSVDASTARRQFKKRFGMTFVAYARARRMGLALAQIRQGEKVINVQLDAGYESSSGFRDAFARIMGATPSRSEALLLKAAWIDTPLGPMMAISDEDALYLLEFVDRRGLEREIERLRQKTKAAITPGKAPPLTSIEKELAAYFAGTLHEFKTPIYLMGSPFQKRVWAALQEIPWGQTRSYKEMALAIDHPLAVRAAASANGANQLALIIPCHRVINSGGELGGYGGGVVRKQWLLDHERCHRKD